MRDSNRWGLALLCLLITAGALMWPRHDAPTNQVLSCRNELYDRHGSAGQDGQSFMQADFVLVEDEVNIHYRYFTEAGTPVGVISMSGRLLPESNSQLYRIAVRERQVEVLDDSQSTPQHMSHLAFISQMNITEQGSHNLSIQMLEWDDQREYAVVYFTPSNAVCSCSLTQRGLG